MSTQEPPIQLKFIDADGRDQIQSLSEAEAGHMTVSPQTWSTRLEGGCPACVAKHLSLAIESLECLTLRKFDPEEVAFTLAQKACILDDESRLGYPGHKWLAAASIAKMESMALGLDKSGELAGYIREVRLSYLRGPCPTLHKDLCVALGRCYPFTNLDGVLTRTSAWAHISEAFAELPISDTENRKRIVALVNLEDPLPEVSGILKNVVETYEL